MDKSEQYIRMCEKAWEIQKDWKPVDGDYCGHDNEGEYIWGNWECPAQSCIVAVSKEKPVEWWLNWLWLPRQDQLQGMIGDSPYNNIQNAMWSILHDLHEYAFTPNMFHDFIPTTMEQLWLLFVMRGKYGKVWNGDDWVKETKS